MYLVARESTAGSEPLDRMVVCGKPLAFARMERYMKRYVMTVPPIARKIWKVSVLLNDDSSSAELVWVADKEHELDMLGMGQVLYRAREQGFPISEKALRDGVLTQK